MGIFSEHFSEKELACRHCGVNLCVSRLVDALEVLRKLVGVPITVNDAYRCAVHNADPKVGGAADSRHVTGDAADIRISGMTPAGMYFAVLKVPAFANGGIGVAIHQGYIHVDTRPVRARWSYDLHGKTCPWDKSLDLPRPAVVS